MMIDPALSGRMGRRIAVVLGLAALLPVVILAIFMARSAGQSNSDAVERRLTGVSQAYARSLRSRLGAAESLVQTLTARDVGYDGSALKQQIINSRAFKSVVVVDRNGLLPGGDASLRPSAAQRLALEAGQTVVMRVALQGQLPGIFLSRMVTAGGSERLSYFEIAPDWLWKDLAGGILATPVTVVDGDGTVLQSTVPLMPETGRMFAHNIRIPVSGATASHSLAWQGAGEEWHGVLTYLSLVDERITTVPWAVVALERGTTFFARSKQVWALLPYAAVFALLLAWVGSAYLVRRHVPALKAVEEGLRTR
jgi:hypothetical protein